MAKLVDVAQYADVSISTVSRVINAPDKVNASTRVRVKQAIEALNYRPSRVARRLRVQDGHAHLLGLVIPDIQNPFYSNVVRGAEDVAYAKNYAVILCSTDEDPEREQFYLDTLRGESVDGIILPPLRHGNTLKRDGGALPIVCFDRRPAVPADTVVVDNRAGARQIVDHLIRLGHRRIGLICGPMGLSTSIERLEGYKAALAAHDLPVEDALVCACEPARTAGNEATDQLLDLRDPPTALFTANNQLTLGALERLRARGLRVPDDVALAGFDDPPWAKLLAPPLTTVRQPAYEMGHRAAELLFQRLAAPDRPPAVVMLQPTLVIRRSCGAPASAASATGERSLEDEGK